MKLLTIEWIEKAEEDWHVMRAAFRARTHPTYSAVCFHAQQCAEKYLKSRLEEAGIAFYKTHDLLQLLTQTLVVEPGWAVLQPELNYLNGFSVIYRYPGHTANKVEAQDAVRACRKVRRLIRTAFGLPL